MKLPKPEYDSKTPIEKALLERMSVREFSDVELTLSEVSQLLWSAQGITGAKRYRTAPSAGALYPLEIYIAAGRVKGLNPGIYKFKPRGHEIIGINDEDKRAELCDASMGQLYVKNCAVIIVISAIYERVTTIYGNRGMRYTYMEVGHAAQNISLQAVSLGLGTVVVGAFNDLQVKKIIEMPEQENPLYLLPVGRKK